MSAYTKNISINRDIQVWRIKAMCLLLLKEHSHIRLKKNY